MATPTPTLVRWDDLDVEQVFKDINDGTIPADEAAAAFDEYDINSAGLQAFIDKHTLTSLWNAKLLKAWCDERDVPLVLHNLEIAAAELKRLGMWEIDAPEVEAPKVAAKAIIATPIVAAQVPPPSPEEQKFLNKVKDDASLTDHARKKRDELLRRAAVASRWANRKSSPSPTVVI